MGSDKAKSEHIVAFRPAKRAEKAPNPIVRVPVAPPADVGQVKDTRDFSTRFKKGQSGNPATQWKPGQSGNLAGGPKKETLETLLRRHLAGTPEGKKDSRMQAMTDAIYDEGIENKNPKVLIALMDRIYPKPKLITISGDLENPIAVTQVTRRIVDESRNPDS